MGYTHHWEVADTILDMRWKQFCQDVKKIIRTSKVKIVRELDRVNEKPAINDNFVSFNGPGDDGYETFYVNRNQPGYAFCKTERKPYDVVVVACWLSAWENRIFATVQSDGDFDDENPFLEGRDLYEKATKTLVKRKQPVRNGKNHRIHR